MTGFTGGEQANPGRFTIFQAEPFHVIGDQTINPHALARVIEIIDALGITGRKIVCMSSAGNRSSEHFAALGQLLAASFDIVIAFDIPRFRRNRAPGEVGAMLKDSVLQAGMAEESIHVAETLDQAIALAAPMIGQGDLLFFTMDHAGDRRVLEAALPAVKLP